MSKRTPKNAERSISGWVRHIASVPSVVSTKQKIEAAQQIPSERSSPLHSVWARSRGRPKKWTDERYRELLDRRQHGEQLFAAIQKRLARTPRKKPISDYEALYLSYVLSCLHQGIRDQRRIDREAAKLAHAGQKRLPEARKLLASKSLTE